ncbi:MAG: ParB/RepB/Spo0J family partition protein [Chloroflexota bacterium]|nr:ParB/RepB/Spo0J family partition protein [Chloroflexota bacterium]
MNETANWSSSRAAEPGLLRIPLELVHPHPLNANVMPDDIAQKVARNIERTGKYPPLLVRPHPDLPGEFELIDGEQRWRILPRMGLIDALCYVWECDDETALVLLATINRLRGDDVPGLRSALLAELDRLLPRDLLETLLPEDASAIDDALTFAELDAGALLADLTAAAEHAPVDGPRLISFAVTPEDEAVIERAVFVASEGLTGANRRGRALAAACRRYLGVPDA